MYTTIARPLPFKTDLYKFNHNEENEERESNPICRAIIKNKFKKLQSLIKSGESINSSDSKGRSALYLSIVFQRVEIFDYLLSFDDIDINFKDPITGNSPLFCIKNLVTPKSLESYFILKLVDRGLDVTATISTGSTRLHLFPWDKADEDSIMLAKAIIEKKLDVNVQNNKGETPLHVACKKASIDWIYILLYHGANATIHDHEGKLPIVLIPQNLPLGNQQEIQEILFDHTFDTNANTIELPTLVEAMTYKTSLFKKILEITIDLSYDMFGLEYLCIKLNETPIEHLWLFVQRYAEVVKEMFQNYFVWETLLSDVNHSRSTAFEDVLAIFLKSKNVYDFIQDLNSSTDVIHSLIHKLYATSCKPLRLKRKKHSNDVCSPDRCNGSLLKIVCLMLSHGLNNVSSRDLDTVYDEYEHCELFEILLHMDIDMTERKKFQTNMTPLYYDFNTNIDDSDFLVTSPPPWLMKNPWVLKNCFNFLEYCNHSKLKATLMKTNDERIVRRVKKLPQVPSLIELSRNVARQYIINRYSIKNSRQFYTILKWLSVGEINRKIIALQTKLYILN